MKRINNLPVIAGVLTTLIIGSVLALLALQKSRVGLSSDYFVLYSALLAISLFFALLALAIDFGKLGSGPSGGLLRGVWFLFEERFIGKASIPASFIIFLLAGLIVGSVVLNTQNNFSVPGAYSDGFALDELSAHSTAENIFFSAVVPGIAEEAIVFFGNLLTIGAILLFLRSAFRVSEKLFYVPVAIVSTALWALAFSLAHARYGGDQAAFVFAWGFEFVVQGLNLLTGSFFSWIPHIMHNGAVVLDSSLALSFLAFIPFVFNRRFLSWVKN